MVKDHEVKPFATLPISAQTTAPILSAFFQHHRIPTLQQLTAENFPDVMKHPAKPLVVLAAFDMERMSKTELGRSVEKLTSIAKQWQASAGRLTDTRPTIFVWMDGERWGKWLKSMYGIKRDNMPSVVIVDHSVSQFSNGISRQIPTDYTFNSDCYTMILILARHRCA